MRARQVHLHPRHVDHGSALTRFGRTAPLGDLVPETVREAAHGGEPDALVVELRGDELPAGVDVADDVSLRHAHIVVVRGGRRVPADSDDRRAFEPRRRRRHDDDRDSLVLGRVGIGAASEPHVVGLVGATGEHLVAVDHPLIAVEDRPRAQRRQVGAGLRFRVADGEVDLAGEDPGQEERLLLVAAEAHDRGPDRVEGDERERRPGPLHLVEEDELVGRRPPLTAVLPGPPDPEPPVRSDLPDDVAEQRAALPRLPQLGPDLGRQQLREVLTQLLAQRLLLGGVLEEHRTSSKSTLGPWTSASSASSSRAGRAPIHARAVSNTRTCTSGCNVARRSSTWSPATARPAASGSPGSPRWARRWPTRCSP